MFNTYIPSYYNNGSIQKISFFLKNVKLHNSYISKGKKFIYYYVQKKKRASWYVKYILCYSYMMRFISNINYSIGFVLPSWGLFSWWFLLSVKALLRELNIWCNWLCLTTFDLIVEREYNLGLFITGETVEIMIYFLGLLKCEWVKKKKRYID